MIKERLLIKAKTITNRKWVIGLLILLNEDVCRIRTEEDGKTKFYECDPDTICQCTGMKDCHRRLIWENDIITCIYNGIVYTRIVVWDQDELDFKGTNGRENYYNNFTYLPCCEHVEVIGNFFDNKDMMQIVHNS